MGSCWGPWMVSLPWKGGARNLDARPTLCCSPQKRQGLAHRDVNGPTAPQSFWKSLLPLRLSLSKLEEPSLWAPPNP